MQPCVSNCPRAEGQGALNKVCFTYRIIGPYQKKNFSRLPLRPAPHRSLRSSIGGSPDMLG